MFWKGCIEDNDRLDGTSKPLWKRVLAENCILVRTYGKLAAAIGRGLYFPSVYFFKYI